METTAPAQDDPYAGLIPSLSGTIPSAVPNIPETLNLPSQMQPFFDYFSWQSFIALNWPADRSAERGTPLNPDSPDAIRSVNRAGDLSSPVVWGTYREGFTLSPDPGETPPPWDADTVKGHRLAMTTKGGIDDEINEAFGGPLIDQNGNYARYEVRVNRTSYDQGRDNGWYDADTLQTAIKAAVARSSEGGGTPEGVQFDTGAMELKGAWREMTDEDDLSRYYTVEAEIYADDGVSLRSTTMGLVGLHIMTKMPGSPQWVWSTFAQVDNVSGTHPSFNNGSTDPTPPLSADQCQPPLDVTPAQIQQRGFDCEPPEIKAGAPFPAKDTRRPVQVTRVTPIRSNPTSPAGFSTLALNRKYQTLLEGTVWENYHLISTQGPVLPGNPSPYNPDFDPERDYNPSLAGNPFPKGVANVAMETYFQVDNSCMVCHYHAAAFGVDYSWLTYDRVLKNAPASPSD